MDKTCKSNAGILAAMLVYRSGERVRNTWVIYREVGNNLPKGRLIPDETSPRHLGGLKAGDQKWPGAL